MQRSLNFLLGAFLMWTSVSAIAKVHTLFHWNIQELSSATLKNRLGGEQMQSVRKIMQGQHPDIVSINELTYDIQNIPNTSYPTNGKNLTALFEFVGYPANFYNTTFHIPNTGLNAKAFGDAYPEVYAGEDYNRSNADLINFGVYPGQYGMGLAYNRQWKKVGETVFRRLLWKDFNPKLDLSEYRDEKGNLLDEETIPLFDKVFYHIQVEVEGRPLHIISLHTVPSFKFKNEHSMNIYRNAEQLRFLTWYLGGARPYPSTRLNVRPLEADSTFVAMGDFNVDPDDDSEGGRALRELIAVVNPAFKERKVTMPKREDGSVNDLDIDHVLFSKDVQIVHAEVLSPDQFPAVAKASDHHPLVVDFQLDKRVDSCCCGIGPVYTMRRFFKKMSSVLSKRKRIHQVTSKGNLDEH